MTSTAATPAAGSGSMTGTSSGSTQGTRSETALDKLVSGRLALEVLRNQLDTTIAGLRAQLVMAEAHKKHAEEMLRKADEKLASHYPESHAVISEGEAQRSEHRSPSRRRSGR